jgi:multidrug efflux pump subunit AcrA (membrane-fusion protein)
MTNGVARILAIALSPARLLCFFLLMLVACSRSAEKSSGPGPAVSEPMQITLSPEAVRTAGIQVAEVKQAGTSRTVSLTGSLSASPWTAEERAALSEAEGADAKRQLAQANFDRLSRLFAQGIVARQDLDASRSERDQAQALAAQADAKRANLGLSREFAPMVHSVKTWGLATLTEADLGKVTTGARAQIQTEAFPGRSFTGKVVAISPSSDAETRSFTIRIAMDDPGLDLRPGMLAKFELTTPGSPGITIPASAVLLSGDGPSVFVATGNVFRKRKIRAGDSTAGSVEVREGLAPGEKIVVAGVQVLESERLKSRLKAVEAD